MPVFHHPEGLHFRCYHDRQDAEGNTEHCTYTNPCLLVIGKHDSREHGIHFPENQYRKIGPKVGIVSAEAGEKARKAYNKNKEVTHYDKGTWQAPPSHEDWIERLIRQGTRTRPAPEPVEVDAVGEDADAPKAKRARHGKEEYTDQATQTLGFKDAVAAEVRKVLLEMLEKQGGV